MRAVYPQVGSGPAEPPLDVIVVEADRSVQSDRGFVVHPRVHDRALHARATQAAEALVQDRGRVALAEEVRVCGDRLEVADTADRVGPRDRARGGPPIVRPSDEIPPVWVG